MIESIEIKGLRGIREGRIEGLAPINVLVGANGCGKSTVLEAVGIACAGEDAAAAMRAINSREWLGIEGVKYWFQDTRSALVQIHHKSQSEDDSLKIARYILKNQGNDPNLLRQALANGAKHPLISLSLDLLGAEGTAHWPIGSSQIVLDSDGRSVFADSGERLSPFSLAASLVDRPSGAQARLNSPVFSGRLRESLAAIKLTPWYDDLLAYLQVFRPSLTSIESLAVGDRDEPHMFEKDPRVGYPVAFAGDGFRRALMLAAAFAEARGGVVAIDEPEAFAYPRMFVALAKMLHRSISDGTQVFFATHSLEFIQTLLREFAGEADKAVVVGLSLDKGVLDPVVIPGAEALQRVVELGDDLRL